MCKRNNELIQLFTVLEIRGTYDFSFRDIGILQKIFFHLTGADPYPENRGAAVDPSKRLFADANEREEKLVWPDVESWDWKGSVLRNKQFISDDRAVFTTIFSGYFERLIPFMDFGNASITDIHSCGFPESRVTSIIHAGWDVLSSQIINDTHKIYENYGDKLIVGVIPDGYTDENPDDQKQNARKFVEKFCNPAKPAVMNHVVNTMLPGTFRAELHKLSRITFQQT